MAVAAFLAFSAEETRAAPHLLKPHNIKENFDKRHFPKQGVGSFGGFSVVGPEEKLVGKLDLGLPIGPHELRAGGQDHPEFSNNFLDIGFISKEGYQQLSGYSPLPTPSNNRLTLQQSWQRFIHSFPSQFALDAYSHRYHAPSFSGPQESVLYFSAPELFYKGISDNVSTTEVNGEPDSEPQESVLDANAHEFLDKSPSTSRVPNYSPPSQEIRVLIFPEQQGHIVEFDAPAFLEESHSTYEFPVSHISTSEVSEQAIPEPHVPGLGFSTSEVLNNVYSDPEIADHIFLLSGPRKSAGSLSVRDNSEQTNLSSPLPIVSTSGVTFLFHQTESNMSSQIQVSSSVVNGTSDKDVNFQMTEIAHSTPTIFGASPAIDPSSLFSGDFMPEISSHPNSDYASQLQTALSSIGPLPLEPHS